jgi:hypothetical protein
MGEEEAQVFVSARRFRALVVRALALAVLLPASAWTAGLLIGGAGSGLPSLRARPVVLTQRDRDRHIVLASHRSRLDADHRVRSTL